MNRRKFMAALGVGALCALGVERCLNNETMRKAPVREGKIIADLHAHPSNEKRERTLEAICSPGILGMGHYYYSKLILDYEGAVRRYSNLAVEIDRGKFARIKSGVGDSYIVRAQEIFCGQHHLLALGIEGSYIPDGLDARKVVEMIHKQKGLAILNHPCLMPYDSYPRYRIVTAKQEVKVRELCSMVDEIEVFNANCINLSYGIMFPNFRPANSMAEQLARKYNFKGIVGSDAHFRPEQLKLCGIYVGKDHMCLDKLKQDIVTGNFDNSYRRYVSRYSFLTGFIFN